MTKDKLIELAQVGMGIHSPNAPEYKICAALIAALEAKDEPDKYAMDIECNNCGAKQSGVLTVHTTPPQRKPLTDEKREEIAKGWRGRNWTVGDIIDAVEAAHGIKGEA